MVLEPYGRTFKLDNQMDIVINDLNRIGMVTGEEKVAQDVQVLFRTHLDDNIFHRDFGLDFEAITLMDYSHNVIKSTIAEAMGQYRFLKEILSIGVRDVFENNAKNIEITLQLVLYNEEEIRLSVVV